MRNNKGRFTLGNKAAVGHENPMARRSQLFRQAILKTVKKSDIIEIIKKLVALAKAGDLTAIKELLDRTCGKVREPLAITDDEIKIILDDSIAKSIGARRYWTPKGEQRILKQEPNGAAESEPEPEPMAGVCGEQEISLDGDDSD